MKATGLPHSFLSKANFSLGVWTRRNTKCKNFVMHFTVLPSNPKCFLHLSYVSVAPATRDGSLSSPSTATGLARVVCALRVIAQGSATKSFVVIQGLYSYLQINPSESTPSTAQVSLDATHFATRTSLSPGLRFTPVGPQGSQNRVQNLQCCIPGIYHEWNLVPWLRAAGPVSSTPNLDSPSSVLYLQMSRPYLPNHLAPPSGTNVLTLPAKGTFCRTSLPTSLGFEVRET